jgi:hypothetical protein
MHIPAFRPFFGGGPMVASEAGIAGSAVLVSIEDKVRFWMASIVLDYT